MKFGLAPLVLTGCLALPLVSFGPVAAQQQPALDAGTLSLRLPEGTASRSMRETALGTYGLPVGTYSDGGIPMQMLEGHIRRRTWHLRADATVLQVLDVLRSQLVEQGYEILFQCDDRQCGGFDFRFGIEVVPAPDMVVSLSDYHFLAVQKQASSGGEDTATSTVSLLVSRSGATTYIQMIEVTPPNQPPMDLIGAADGVPAPMAAQSGAEVAATLEQEGHVVLPGVVFSTGAKTLGQAAVDSLKEIADFLTKTPKAQVLIVGHTDSVGRLEGNIALSLSRAGVVKDTLVQTYGIATGRIAVAGAGYMAPIASNLTEEGREHNRRVEVVLLAK